MLPASSSDIGFMSASKEYYLYAARTFFCLEYVIDGCIVEPAVTRSSPAGTTTEVSTTQLHTGTSLPYVVTGTTQPTFGPAQSTTAGMPVPRICCQYRLLLGRFSNTSQTSMRYFYSYKN